MEIPYGIWCRRTKQLGVFDSAYLKQAWDDMIQVCVDRQELSHVCIDGTVRCAMQVRGQANYRALVSVRNRF